MPPAHPEIRVKLTGTDGNAFAIMAKVSLAMKRAGLPQSEIDAFRADAMAGDYDHLLRAAMRAVTVS